MIRLANVSLRYDEATMTFSIVNPETNIEFTLPKKFTTEIRKVIRER